VARSARQLGGAALVIVTAGLLGGCSSTQTEAARDRINNARIITSQSVTHVTASASGGAARVTGVTVIDRGRAFVVTVVNESSKAVTNLPLSVGYHSHGKTVYLNARVGLPYFATHTAAIRGRATLRWVYVTGLRLPSGVRPFAYLGSRAVPAMAVQATAGVSARAGRRDGSQVLVQVSNLTGIPQTQLPVYVYVRDGGKIIGAGVSSVALLGGGATDTVRVTVLGTASTGNVAAEAPATIYN